MSQYWELKVEEVMEANIFGKQGRDGCLPESKDI